MDHFCQISVIVPVYNSETTLARCVDSLLSQTFKEFEVLLVDDGSEDSSPEICEKYALKDARVKAWHKSNGGVSSARNFGLDRASGKYVCFADSDDYVTDIWLDNFARIVHKYPGSLIIQNVMIKEPSKEYLRYENLNGICRIEQIWELGNWGYSWNKIFRKDIIDEHGLRFDESLKVYEDELFVAEYSSSFNTAYVIPTVGYHYLNTILLADRYKNDLNISTMSYLYQEVRAYNYKCSIYMVDRMVMSMYGEMKKSGSVEPFVRYLNEEVGEDIRYAKGKKKFFIRFLHKTNNIRVWEFVFMLYLRFNLI